MAKILITGAFKVSSEFSSCLKSIGLTVVYLPNELEEITMNLDDIEVVICNTLFLHTSIDRFKSLKYIQVTSAGLDRLPLDKIKQRGIKLYNARGVYSIPMAEWALCNILTLYKNVHNFQLNQSEKSWIKDRNIKELNGKSALVVGFGSVGQETAKRLWAMGVQVSAIDIVAIEAEYINRCFEIDYLKDIIADFDILVLTLPLTEQTYHLFDDKMFSLMKKGALLVNISRGSVIDESSLIRAIESDKLSGVALDVFEQEPLSENSPLWSFNQVIITPHNSFVSENNFFRLENLILNNLKAYYGE